MTSSSTGVVADRNNLNDSQVEEKRLRKLAEKELERQEELFLMKRLEEEQRRIRQMEELERLREKQKREQV